MVQRSGNYCGFSPGGKQRAQSGAGTSPGAPAPSFDMEGSRPAAPGLFRRSYGPYLTSAPRGESESRMRVLVANVYYPPIAFGGATIVAEQTTTLLSKMPDVECLFLCL